MAANTPLKHQRLTTDQVNVCRHLDELIHVLHQLSTEQLQEIAVSVNKKLAERSSASYLLHLNHDILLHIYSYCKITDIVTIRCCNKQLYNSIQYSGVWKNKRFVYQPNTPVPSYADRITTLSINSDQLQHIEWTVLSSLHTVRIGRVHRETPFTAYQPIFHSHSTIKNLQLGSTDYSITVIDFCNFYQHCITYCNEIKNLCTIRTMLSELHVLINTNQYPHAGVNGLCRHLHPITQCTVLTSIRMKIRTVTAVPMTIDGIHEIPLNSVVEPLYQYLYRMPQLTQLRIETVYRDGTEPATYLPWTNSQYNISTLPYLSSLQLLHINMPWSQYDIDALSQCHSLQSLGIGHIDPVMCDQLCSNLNKLSIQKLTVEQSPVALSTSTITHPVTQQHTCSMELIQTQFRVLCEYIVRNCTIPYIKLRHNLYESVRRITDCNTCNRYKCINTGLNWNDILVHTHINPSIQCIEIEDGHIAVPTIQAISEHATTRLILNDVVLDTGTTLSNGQFNRAILNGLTPVHNYRIKFMPGTTIDKLIDVCRCRQ